MERLSLFLFWFIWLQCNTVASPSKVGRLIIRANEHIEETINFMTDCNCDLDGEMKFSIASHLLPDIDGEQTDEPIDIAFSNHAVGCTAIGGHIDFDPAMEANVVFKVNANCGVHIDNGRLPIYIAEKFSGHKMEASIPLTYIGSSGEKNNLLAHMTCVCPDENVEQGPCKNNMFHIDQSFQCDKEHPLAPVGSLCSVVEDQLDNCGVAITQTDNTIHFQGQFSLLPNKHGRYDCRFIHDEDDYLNIMFDINHDVKMPVGPSFLNLTNQKHHVHYTCLKPATWTRWSGWSSCSVTCGSGNRIRRRYCNNGAVGLPGCEDLDEEKENCEGTNKCPLKCPDGTTMSHEDVKCRCDLMPRARYVLFPHALASHAFSTIKSSLTFKSAPDMERTVAIMREYNGQTNFQPVTLDIEWTSWIFDKHSPKLNINYDYWGQIFMSDEDDNQMLFETIWPIDLSNMRIRRTNIQQAQSAADEAKYHEKIIDGEYQLTFQHSSIIDIGDGYESVMSVLVHLSDTTSEEIMLITKLDKLHHWCSDSIISKTMPSWLQRSEPTDCQTSFGECIKPDIDQSTTEDQCFEIVETQPENDNKNNAEEDDCPAVRPICDSTDNDINPCNLGITGNNVGFVTFTRPENCGECTNCNQLQIACIEGQPIYSSIGCGSLCVACNDADYGTAPFPLWQQWGACDHACGGGSTKRYRNKLAVDNFSKLSQQLTCQADILYFNAAIEQVKECNTLCCGCCDLPVEEQCPDNAQTACQQLPECTNCDQTDTITCAYHDELNDCEMHCKRTRKCNDTCCNVEDGVEVAETRACISEHDCAVGEWQWQVASKCPQISIIKTQTGEQCPRDGRSCTCTKPKADLSSYNCVDVTFETECVVKNDVFVKVTKHCKLTNDIEKGSIFCEEYDLEAPCVAPACDLSAQSTTNCCLKPSCSGIQYPVGDCKIPKVCFNHQGVEFIDGSFDCCSGKLECDGDQLKTCKPCDFTFAKPPECLSASNNVFCQKEDCKYPVYKCPACQSAFCKFTTGEDIKVVTITNDLLNSVQFDLPATLYTPEIRFFIGRTDSFNTNGCYHDFDRDQVDGEITLQYKRSELFKCGVGTAASEDDNLKTIIYVDKSNAVSTEVSTHTPFLEIDCETKPTIVEQTVIVSPNFDPVEFKGIIPGDVNITFDISTDRNFEVLMEDSDDLNAVLVGELLYARIVSNKEFKITRCTMYDNNNPTHRYNMLVDGCPDDEDLTRIFHFEYLKTSQPFTTIFQWQNFIFRDGAEEQVLVYECEVAPCYDNCQPSCGNRKRRNQPEPLIKHESFNPTRFNFQLEVYKTREALVEALRARKNEYTQEMLITICSSVLMFGLVLGMATYWMSRFGNAERNDKPYRMENFQAQLKSMLDAKFRQQRNTLPPPPYPGRLTKNNNEFGNKIEMLIDDPNFMAKTLTPKLEVKQDDDC